MPRIFSCILMKVSINFSSTKGEPHTACGCMGLTVKGAYSSDFLGLPVRYLISLIVFFS